MARDMKPIADALAAALEPIVEATLVAHDASPVKLEVIYSFMHDEFVVAWGVAGRYVALNHEIVDDMNLIIGEATHEARSRFNEERAVTMRKLAATRIAQCIFHAGVLW